jgi:IstB-like ATP binding protein
VSQAGGSGVPASPHSIPSTNARARSARGQVRPGQPEQGAASVGQVRGALAVEVGEEGEAARAGARRQGQPVQLPQPGPAQLSVLIRRHRADGSVAKAIGRILRADLVVVDDVGPLPVGPDAAEGLYRLVDAAYEKRSVAVSSNLHPPSGFDELMPKTLATATVDRLMHHAHVCRISGDSIRLTQALEGREVIPLN